MSTAGGDEVSTGIEDPDDGTSSDGPSIDQRRPHFDALHYRSQLSWVQRRRLRRDGVDEFDHYLATGWTIGLDPSPGFSTEGYLHDHPDVRVAGVDPLTHWVHFGQHEGRSVVSPEEFAAPDRTSPLDPALAEVRDAVVEHLAGLGLDIDPLELHAPLRGLESEPPSWFDAKGYLAANGDVASAGIDPFSHYVRFGFRERRWPNAEVAVRAGTISSPIDRILSARDIRTETALRLAKDTTIPAASPTIVLDRIRAALSAAGRGPLVIAIGHDDYTSNTGGVQLCEGLEQREFARRRRVHVFVHPSVPLRTLHPPEGDPLVRIVLDGVAVGHDFRIADLVAEWADAGLDGDDVEAVVVHSILGHSPERIGDLIATAGPRRAVWWIHDHLSQCPNWYLLRNGVEPCGAPPLTSTSCRLCAWGPERGGHLRRLGRLWSQASWEFCAPSESAATSAMSGSAPLPVAPVVIPHLELRQNAEERPPLGAARRTPRIGFIGEPRAEKGWGVFTALVASAPEGVEFVHIGARPGVEPGIEFVAIRQTADSMGAMVDAIRGAGVDAALIWPGWGETFSFVTAEAIAAGCEILTHRHSGNVVAMAERHGRAVVFDSVDGLMAADVPTILRHRRDRATPAWDIHRGSGLTPALLDRTDPAAIA